jgi:hypothetical protein
MAVHGKDYGEKAPFVFSTDLGNRKNRFPHSLSPDRRLLVLISIPKGAFPSSPDLRSLQAHPSIGKDLEPSSKT